MVKLIREDGDPAVQRTDDGFTFEPGDWTHYELRHIGTKDDICIAYCGRDPSDMGGLFQYNRNEPPAPFGGHAVHMDNHKDKVAKYTNKVLLFMLELATQDPDTIVIPKCLAEAGLHLAKIWNDRNS